MVKRFTTTFLALILSVNMLFSTTYVSYYQAAELGGTIVWTLIETLFLSLGVSFQIADTVDKTSMDDIIADDIRTVAENIQDNSKKGPLLELADYIGNIVSHWDDVTGLTVPQTIWEALKYYCGSHAAPRPVYKPTINFDNVDLYGCTQTEYYQFYLDFWNYNSSSSCTNLVNTTFNDFIENDYSCLLFRYPLDITFNDTGRNYGYFVYYSLDHVNQLRWREYSSSVSSTSLVLINENGITLDTYKYATTDEYDMFGIRYYVDKKQMIDWFFGKNNSFTSAIGAADQAIGFDPAIHDVSEFDYLLISHGKVYDLFEILDFPVNSTGDCDYGNIINTKEDFSPNTVISDGIVSSVISDVMDIPADDYDILTPGRDLDKDEDKVVGDVIIGIPTGNELDDYRNGLITWEELMEKIGVEPVDTSKGETIDGKPIEDAIIDSTGSIIDTLLNIPAAILDGLLGLFVPSEGFFESFFERLNQFLEDKLGLLYAPIGLFIDLLTAIMNADTSDSTLYFPGIKFMEYEIVAPQNVDLDASEYIPVLKSTCHFITNVLLVFAVIILLQNKLKEVMSS